MKSDIRNLKIAFEGKFQHFSLENSLKYGILTYKGMKDHNK